MHYKLSTRIFIWPYVTACCDVKRACFFQTLYTHCVNICTSRIHRVTPCRTPVSFATQEEGKLAHETALLALLGEDGGASVQLAAQVETLVALLLGLGRGARGLVLCIEVPHVPRDCLQKRIFPIPCGIKK